MPHLSPTSIAAIAAMTLTLSGCGTDGKQVSYAEVGGQDLKMILFTPPKSKNAEPTRQYPAILVVHGGGWAYPVDAALRPVQLRAPFTEANLKALAAKGYIVASTSYRLTKTLRVDEAPYANPWPAQIQDVKCAVRWLRTHADEYQIDTTKIGVTGHSAGGHLALMLGETDSTDGFDPAVCPSEGDASVQAVSAWSAPSDTLEWWGEQGGTGDEALELLSAARGWLATLIGDTDPETEGEQYTPFYSVSELRNRSPGLVEQLENASPIRYIDSVGAPTLLIHSSNDDIVEPEISDHFYAKLNEFGRTAALTPIHYGGHAYTKNAATDAFTATTAWFDYYLKGISPKCTDAWPTCTIPTPAEKPKQ
ncbi:Hypothetical protein HDN1F_28680 [gamma proteobacterium HdN1]|nr:Hypothetical protein HDN1F_28680 [gamma proteobacterium HdN1]